MKKERTLIYLNVNPETHEIVYSGIEFADFIKYVIKPIENIMIITGGSGVISLESKFDRGLELFEGYELVQKLSEENVHGFGDFCFVDYTSSHKTTNLNEEQVAELLYLGHMFKPLKSPFFKELQNRFVYLAHDDGFFCKLYCHKFDDYFSVLNGKIVSATKNIIKGSVSNLDVTIQKDLLKFAEGGLLIDFKEITIKDDEISIKVYSVGKFTDMDKVLNECRDLKEKSLYHKCIKYRDNKWCLE